MHQVQHAFGHKAGDHVHNRYLTLVSRKHTLMRTVLLQAEFVKHSLGPRGKGRWKEECPCNSREATAENEALPVMNEQKRQAKKDGKANMVVRSQLLQL